MTLTKKGGLLVEELVDKPDLDDKLLTDDTIVDECDDEADVYNDSDYEMDVDIIDETEKNTCTEWALEVVETKVDPGEIEYGDDEEEDLGMTRSDDDLDSIGGDSDKEDDHRFFNPKTTRKIPNLYVGLKFHSREEMRNVIKSHLFKQGKAPYFKHRAALRIIVRCQNPTCSFYVYASKPKNGGVWQLKTVDKGHATDCGKIFQNKFIKSSWLGRMYLYKLHMNPKMDVDSFQTMLTAKLKTEIERYIAYRGLKAAYRIINGHHLGQFKRIHDYCEEIIQKNPGVTSVMGVGPGVGHLRQFKRLYFNFKACRDGFLRGCRPLIGVDGCFLRGPFVGQVLVAVALDPNNCLFPIAWSVVEGENKNSWIWFLRLLIRDLGIYEENQVKYTFISDKDKGLKTAFNEVVPGAANRFCVRHLWTNMKKKAHSSAETKIDLWRIAVATREELFESQM